MPAPSGQPSGGQLQSSLSDIPTHLLVQELQRRHRSVNAPTSSVAVLGPPGSGKSSIADHLRYNLGFCSVLPLETDTRLASAEQKVARVKERLEHEPRCRQGGRVVDGFPLNVNEAELLDKIFPVDRCVVLQQNDAEKLHLDEEGRFGLDLARVNKEIGEVEEWFLSKKGVKCLRLDAGAPKEFVVGEAGTWAVKGGEGAGAAE